MSNPIIAGHVATALTSDAAIQVAQTIAYQNGAPVRIWEGAYAYYISESPDDDYDVSPEDYGYSEYAVVDPQEDEL